MKEIWIDHLIENTNSSWYLQDQDIPSLFGGKIIIAGGQVSDMSSEPKNEKRKKKKNYGTGLFRHYYPRAEPQTSLSTLTFSFVFYNTLNIVEIFKPFPFPRVENEQVSVTVPRVVPKFDLLNS